jgi:hypothetical protein
MKKIILTLLFVCSSVAIIAQESTTTHCPVQVTFFYPLGTNGTASPSYSTNFSFNMLYGITGGVNGVEIGGLTNTNLGSVQGLQVAGIANINTKETNGIVVGGIANINKGFSQGLSVGGIYNLSGNGAIGIQAGGIANTVNGDFLGLQVAGITNVLNGSSIGAQIAGISNVNNGNSTGLQVSGISNVIAGDLKGAQIGLINRAGRVQGAQLGLINIAQSYEDGVPLGLISYVKEGYHAIELSSNEMIYGNIDIKLGVDQFYTIYKMGYTNRGGDEAVSYGLGVGSLIKLTEKLHTALDLSASQLVNLWSPDMTRLQLLSRADFRLRYQFHKNFSVFAGPSLNVYANGFAEDGATSIKEPYTIAKYDWWNNNGSTALWIGGSAGLSINF